MAKPQGVTFAKQCPARAQWDTVRPCEPLPPSPFLQRLFTRGRDFESEVVAQLLELHPDALTVAQRTPQHTCRARSGDAPGDARGRPAHPGRPSSGRPCRPPGRRARPPRGRSRHRQADKPVLVAQPEAAAAASPRALDRYKSAGHKPDLCTDLCTRREASTAGRFGMPPPRRASTTASCPDRRVAEMAGRIQPPH